LRHNELCRFELPVWGLHVPAKYIPDAPLKNDVHIRTTDTGEVETIRFVRSCVYLGAVMHESLSDDVEISGGMLKVTQVFGMLRKEMLASKDMWPEVKKRSWKA
jgi:hypothetical protein